MPQKSSGGFFALLYWCSLVSTLDCPLPPPVTGGVCLATRVRYRQSCGLDTWSASLAYLFVSRICVAGLCFFCFFCSCFIFSPPLRSDRGRLSRLLFFFLSFSSFVCFFGCSDGTMEREACVCDHGFERSDLCAEIIIIIIIK